MLGLVQLLLQGLDGRPEVGDLHQQLQLLLFQLAQLGLQGLEKVEATINCNNLKKAPREKS